MENVLGFENSILNTIIEDNLTNKMAKSKMYKPLKIAYGNVVNAIVVLMSEVDNCAILELKTVKICNQYLPNADDVMIGTIVDFACRLYGTCYQLKILRSEFSRYNKNELACQRL